MASYRVAVHYIHSSLADLHTGVSGVGSLSGFGLPAVYAMHY